MEDKEQIQINILNNTISLDYPCSKCCEAYVTMGYTGYQDPLEISGFKIGFQNGELCPACNNTRFTLTNVGQAIMDLVRRHKQ